MLVEISWVLSGFFCGYERLCVELDALLGSFRTAEDSWKSDWVCDSFEERLEDDFERIFAFGFSQNVRNSQFKRLCKSSSLFFMSFN